MHLCGGVGVYISTKAVAAAVYIGTTTIMFRPIEAHFEAIKSVHVLHNNYEVSGFNYFT